MKKYFCRKCGKPTPKTRLLCDDCKKKIYWEMKLKHKELAKKEVDSLEEIKEETEI